MKKANTFAMYMIISLIDLRYKNGLEKVHLDKYSSVLTIRRRRL